MKKRVIYPGRRILRKMGYINDQKGIMNRYLRESEGWDEHIEHTRAFITAHLMKHNPPSLSVLGSGWLLDFPLEEAVRICERIELVDIHHPPQILKKLEKFPTVEPVYSDISGGMIRNVYDFVRTAGRRKNPPGLDAIEFTKPERNPEGVVISLNVLNQLDILIVDYLLRFLKVSDLEIDSFRRKLQQSHLDLMQAGDCLVTDIEERIKNRHNGKQDMKKLVYSKLPRGKYQRNWTWNFDSAGNYRENSEVEMTVTAVSF